MRKHLVAFDMDGTLLDGAVVSALSERLGLTDTVTKIQSDESVPGFIKTNKIAKLWKGLLREDIESAVESIPLMKNCQRTICILKEHRNIVGIISDSYNLAAKFLAKRLDLDFVVANHLEDADGVLSGEVRMPKGWDRIDCYCKISVCKRYHLEKYAKKYEIPIRSTVAIGDTKSDSCMVGKAGIGIAFLPKDEIIRAFAKHLVTEKDLGKVLHIIDHSVDSNLRCS